MAGEHDDRNGDGTWRDAARAFGVMLGPVAVLDLAALTALRAAARAVADRRPVPRAAAAGSALVAAYAVAVRPWMLHWGATDAERDGGASTRSITVDAPVDEVWPWLAQIGQDRGGFYSYEWLENLAGCELHNADEVHPEWQHREVGELLPLHPQSGLPLARFDPPHVLELDGWGSFTLSPLPGDRTRLIVRGAPRSGLVASSFNVLCIEIPHFLMERKMMLGIKARAERKRARHDGGSLAASSSR